MNFNPKENFNPMSNIKRTQGNNEKAILLTNCSDEWHIYEWLDLLVHFTLNPEKHFVDSITCEDDEQIEDLLRKETLKLRRLIQQQVFSAHTKSEAELFVRNCHVSITMMLGQSFENLENISNPQSPAARITKLLIQHFEELISLIEGRFAMYLSLDEYVPKTYFQLAQKELALRLRKLKNKIAINSPFKIPFEIIVNKLNRFLNTNEFEKTTSYKNIIYKKKLITEVEKVEFKVEEFQSYTKLDEVLIYMNFNSVEYINYLISIIKKRIGNLITPEEKSKQLYLLHKSFNQLYKKPGAAYNQNFHSIELLLNNWFTQELEYLEKIRVTETTAIMTSSSLPKTGQLQMRKQKILCMLSSDQIGLILRAAEELRILAAKSMNELFKTIVPWLSTAAREDLSYDGMRSKSYVAEERDKRLAMEALEQIIRRIKEY